MIYEIHIADIKDHSKRFMAHQANADGDKVLTLDEHENYVISTGDHYLGTREDTWKALENSIKRPREDFMAGMHTGILGGLASLIKPLITLPVGGVVFGIIEEGWREDIRPHVRRKFVLDREIAPIQYRFGDALLKSIRHMVGAGCFMALGLPSVVIAPSVEKGTENLFNYLIDAYFSHPVK